MTVKELIDTLIHFPGELEVTGSLGPGHARSVGLAYVGLKEDSPGMLMVLEMENKHYQLAV